MLQTQIVHYASDAIEDAMRLAQTKALNSFSWADCIDYLNYSWMDMYHRLAQIDDGFYSVTIKLTNKLTRLPAFVKNTLRVYSAQSPVGFNRIVYRASGMNDLRSSGTYHISGFDLWCPDAERRTVWLSYMPMQPQLFFPMYNRDPKILDWNTEAVESMDYRLYTLDKATLQLKHKNTNITDTMDISFIKSEMGDDWDLTYISCDFPYIFVSFQHKYSKHNVSGLYKDIQNNQEFVVYNPFDFTGRQSNIRYLKCSWNDRTGMGVVVKDFDDYYDVEVIDPENDQTEIKNVPRVKELGFTPDTVLNYPCPEMYRLLVARLADKFSALNESNVMGVQKELTEATYAFNAFCQKDKSAWVRMDTVNGPTMGDIL